MPSGIRRAAARASPTLPSPCKPRSWICGLPIRAQATSHALTVRRNTNRAGLWSRIARASGRRARRKNMEEYNLIYEGLRFNEPDINPVVYRDSYFDIEIEKESELFYEMRLKNDMKPYKLSDESSESKEEIRKFFNSNKDTFLFLFSDTNEFIGSILFIKNYIQSLCVDRAYQRQGYGIQLVKYVINRIYDKGYSSVELKVFKMNQIAFHLYEKLGFEIA
jgi:ribosomal protein S18 acetylase RimI-like enzyme